MNIIVVYEYNDQYTTTISLNKYKTQIKKKN